MSRRLLQLEEPLELEQLHLALQLAPRVRAAYRMVSMFGYTTIDTGLARPRLLCNSLSGTW